MALRAYGAFSKVRCRITPGAMYTVRVCTHSLVIMDCTSCVSIWIAGDRLKFLKPMEGHSRIARWCLPAASTEENTVALPLKMRQQYCAHTFYTVLLHGGAVQILKEAYDIFEMEERYSRNISLISPFVKRQAVQFGGCGC